MIALIAFLFLSAPSWASFSAQVKSTTDVYNTHLSALTQDVVPYLQLELSQKTRLRKNWRLQMRGTLLTSWQVRPKWRARPSPEGLYADLPEGFLEYKFSDLKLRAGMNTVNWGVMDIASPSDVVNTSALFHPLRTTKRGAPMLEAQWTRENLGLHAIYIPRQQRPLLPARDSRWLPRRFLMNLEAEHTRILLPDPVSYEYDSPETLNHALDHNYGAKLTSHLGKVDLQLTHFEGASPSPKVRPTITIDATQAQAQALSPIRLAPVTYRVRTSGAGLTWAREKWIWRAETAYQNSVSQDPLLQSWSWMSVVGGETNLDLGHSTMTWLAQYYHTQNPQAPDNLISSSYRLFDRTALLGSRWAVSDRFTVLISALFEIQSRGLFAMAGFDYKVTDALKWGLAWRDFSADGDGLLKTYERNDHATLDLTYFF